MDARKQAWAIALLALLSLAARYQTPNFIITAPTKEIAEQVGQAAEKYRREITQDWLGYVMPEWSRRCPITVRLERGAGGVTTFNFANGQVFGWNMTVQGPLDQILDSVLPHEITHTIFASHFRQPLPRWADEGACTTVESPKERTKQNHMLVQFLRTGRGIAFSHMFRMKEYPKDVLPLYAQGHSLSTFLIGQKGKSKFMEYLADGMKSEDWAAATQRHYGYRGLGELQNSWLDWVQKGSPGMDFSETSIAMRLASGRVAGRTRGNEGAKEGGLVYRGQSPEPAAGRSQLAPVRAVAAPSPSNRSPSADAAAAQVPSREQPRAEPAWSAANPTTSTPETASGDSAGWHSPRRETPSGHLGDPTNDQREPLSSLAAPSTTADRGFSGPSRYERAGAVAAQNEFPGQHLPDVAARPASPQRLMHVPSTSLPRRPVFAPPQPSTLMPCFGGS